MSDPPTRQTESDQGAWTGSRSRKVVVIVGAGVSGCACAATLSARGVAVTVMTSALDAVGQPSYGPVVDGGDGGWHRIIDTLAALPRPLRSVWLDASNAPDAEALFFFVDRRMLSIETKRALEKMPGLEFRQGLVTELMYVSQKALDAGARPSDGEDSDGQDGCQRRLAIGTAFGETIEADVVILAVGMSLDGRVRVGDAVLSGGRYGETPAEGLRAALESLGAVFGERTIEVGPRLGRRTLGPEFGAEVAPGWQAGECGRSWGRSVGVVSLRERVEAAGGVSLTAATPASAWPEDYPPASHWAKELRSAAVFVAGPPDGPPRPWLSPDGAALGEIHRYSSPRGSAGTEENDRPVEVGEDLAGGTAATRLGHTVTGGVVTNTDRAGRLVVGRCPAPPVWVCGRAGGATDYLDSLVSGVQTAREVAEIVTRCDGRESFGEVTR